MQALVQCPADVGTEGRLKEGETCPRQEAALGKGPDAAADGGKQGRAETSAVWQMLNTDSTRSALVATTEIQPAGAGP